MINWRTIKVGDKLEMRADDFGTVTTVSGTVTEVHADHAVMKADDGYTLWIDDFNSDLFFE